MIEAAPAEVRTLLAELPARVSALIDTSVFRHLSRQQRAAVESLAELAHVHLVIYDLHS